ncbi:unnamed protein product [Darwinula stevensoni]|uniref:Uncharacterized protein n=1 Tax=Darwinula stevensoni TaxID=69355 RepID=A0A7R9ACU8_9CRUS|nr:unnamed protein product [Darwinula stevensoni]CAG0900354.1 unnamed protein product [Darwinula stevensoni]
MFSPSELEGTAMLDMLAGTGGFWNRAGGLRGEIIVNGSHLQARKLRHRVAYVQQNQDFQPNMSVRQTLLFHAFLREPGNAARDTDTKGRVRELFMIIFFPHFFRPVRCGRVVSRKSSVKIIRVMSRRFDLSDGIMRFESLIRGPGRHGAHAGVAKFDTCPTQRMITVRFAISAAKRVTIAHSSQINALIEDLGLSQVRHTRVHDLTLSEKLRLNVACHLLLETDLIFLDQPTKGMDIFDTFFLVEYLRQWALRGRIVVTTLNPPTYEIFTMVSRVALLSTGRLMYCGKRREMLPYFAFIEYPCPAYKNPADYYLDLVTLDDLSAEAMLESSQRVKQLAEIFKRRQEPLSDPGPPGVLPPKVHSAGCMTEFLALWVRAMVYTFPNNVIAWAFRVLLAAILSLCIGTIWFDTRTDSRQEQMHVNDRLGFHYLMMGLGIWPSILLDLSDAWSEKAPITRDVSDGLYSKVNFIFCKMLYSTPAAFGVFLAYLIPAYALSGLQGSQGANTFLLYLGFMLLYLYTVRSLALACVYLFSSRHVAAVIVGTVTTLLLLPSGYAIHTDDLQPWVSWLAYASPSKWMYQEVVVEELRSIDEFKCSTNPPTKQEDIIYQLPCGVQTGRQALSFMAFNTKQELILPLLVTGGFLVACHILSIFFFLAKTQLPKRSRSKLERM